MMVWEMVMEHFITMKEGNIVVIGLIIRCMERVHFFILMEGLPIKENGKMIPYAEGVSNITKTLRDWTNNSIINPLIKHNYTGSTTKELSTTTINGGKALYALAMDKNTKVNSKMTLSMEEAFFIV